MNSDNKDSIILNTIKWTAFLMLSTVGVMVCFGLILGYLEQRSQAYLYGSFGWGGIVVTGIIGTPIHEFAHFIMCKVFGYQVYEVKLFRPIAGRADGILGYVSYSLNSDNLWQKLGTFFVGIAPMILGPIILIILFRVLLPSAYKEIKSRTDNTLKDENITLSAVFTFAKVTVQCLLKELFRFEKGSIGYKLLFLYLTVAISSHTTLSLADIRNSVPGLLVIFVIFLIIGLLTAITKVNIARDLIRIALMISSFFIIALIFSLLGTVLSHLIYIIIP